MGLLSEGTPLSWEETKKWAAHVRKHGVLQFIHLYHKLKDRKGDTLMWGDEVEYMVIKLDHANKVARVSLRAGEILEYMLEKEKMDKGVRSLWRPEYASYMLEGTPGKPYGGLMAHFNIVEANMKARREEVKKLLKDDEIILSLTSFFRLGCPGFTDPLFKPNPIDGASKSLFFPDEAIFQGHPRFTTLTRNIRERRGEKIAINIPIFKDKNTKDPFIEDLKSVGGTEADEKAALPDHIYMDAMGFGMGCCCLQVTFQACDIDEARTLYDQLAPLCPILVALTASSPVYRGLLSDHDSRWNVISKAVDCRTREERGLEPLKNDRFQINKSRYDSIDSYLCPSSKRYNDLNVVYDKEVYEQLRDAEIDHALAIHLAHLFIRDPVSLFSEKLHQNDEQDTDHFENIQSTNWQTMRFKPPPPNSSIGWRVEFRPCDIQLTDFENAAFVCFIVLMTRVILTFNINLLIPISKVDENLQNAQKKNAALEQKFWFRKDILSSVSPQISQSLLYTKTDDGESFTKMSVDEIINGKVDEFPGLIPLIDNYLQNTDIDADAHCTIRQYLQLIKKRASGQLLTPATWIRNFITSHPSYRQDSVVSQEMTYDLIVLANQIQNGNVECPELLGSFKATKTMDNIPEAIRKADFIKECNGENQG